MKITDQQVKSLTDMNADNIEGKIKSFVSLLNELSDVSDKQKKLWKEIYENALIDRHNAYNMFLELTAITQDKSAEHAIHGRSISAYLERMGKANEQLIRLAELIAKSDSGQKDLTPDEIFSKIKG
jgi:hypothetical protein